MRRRDSDAGGQRKLPGPGLLGGVVEAELRAPLYDACRVLVAGRGVVLHALAGTNAKRSLADVLPNSDVLADEGVAR